MLKFVIAAIALLAIASASNFEYLDNVIEYDVSPNVISPLPYPYREGFRGHRVNLESKPSYVTLVAPEDPKTEVVSSELGLIATAASYAVTCVKFAVSFVINNLSALILGSTVALGICKLTSLCDQGDTLLQLQREIRSLASPQRIKRAAEFVENAIRKYNAMQQQ